MGWAQANGLETPGGFVVPAERLWAVLEACDAREQARYLERTASRLDPRHTLDIATSIGRAMEGPTLEALARADADAAFGRLAGGRIVCRSSSAMEDGRAAAFPGVFVSVLNIDSAACLGTAIAACWRSVFSAGAIRYLLRVGADRVDFSHAVLVQRQVEAAWYGLYVSVDPLTGAAEPLADLSDAEPDALTGGSGTKLQARRRRGCWSGTDEAPSVAASLEKVHEAAARLGGHLRAEVDLEFALPVNGGEPVILQCRPLTHARRRLSTVASGAAGEGHLRGRPCATGHALGIAVDADGGEDEIRGDGTEIEIAVVEHLTTADYGTVFRHAGVVMEGDASPLSHVAILCRELGVPFICGVDGARSKLVGRRVAMNGASGEIEVLQDGDGDAAPCPDPRPPPGKPALSAIELLLRLLAEGRPGYPALAEARRIAQRGERALNADSMRLTAPSVEPPDLERLDRFGVALFGPDFSSAQLLADLAESASASQSQPPSAKMAR